MLIQRMQPLLSICIPTFNRARLLAQTLESITKQNIYQKNLIEICISDNSSNNESKIVFDSFYKHYSNLYDLKYVRHEPALDIDENMLFSAKMGSGDYIYWIGDDDCLGENALSSMVDYLHLKPDLLLINAEYRSEDLAQKLGLAFKQNQDCIYRDSSTVFKNFWCDEVFAQIHFGLFALKREAFQTTEIQKFIKTYHAYSAIPLLYLATIENFGNRTIDVRLLSTPLIIIRCAERLKTWRSSMVDVYYLGIPNWLELMSSVPRYRELSLLKGRTFLNRLYSRKFIFKLLVSSDISIFSIPFPKLTRHRFVYVLLLFTPVKGYIIARRCRLYLKKLILVHVFGLSIKEIGRRCFKD